MKKEDMVFIGHILEQIELIEKSTNRISREEFNLNLDIKDATIRRIEIMGEAVKNISEEFKRIHPEIEWRKIAGIRDKIIHKYFEIDWEIVWAVIQQDMKPLKEKILKIKENIETDRKVK